MPVHATSASGGSDPRTVNALFLFEEFVPLEYRQQLVETHATRRRLPSLFSPSSKQKQWKPAPTLNGRPYVVGHVPRSPSYREVEFEGLLRGNASATKIISLSKRTAQAPRSSLAPPSSPPERTATPRPRAVVVPQTPMSPPRQELPQPMTPAKKVGSRDSDYTPTTPQSAKRMSRFRLPGGIPVPSPGGGRKSGMVPSEYSTVDFETRLAGYSDDESGSGSGGGGTPKHKKRESRDDAWVDILVATHSRRLGGQEAEMRKPGDRIRGLKGGRSDPELASMEVAQALAGIRARSPPSDDEFLSDRYQEPVSVYRTSDIEPHEEVVAEPDTSRDLTEVDPEQDPDVSSIMSHPRKRMGYFDLHPERRPLRKSEEEEDPRSRIAQAQSDDEDDEPVYGSQHTAPQQIEIPEFDNDEEQRHEKETSHSRVESVTLPQIIVPPKRTSSKTAALIEMYREKERESTTSTKPPGSPVSPAVTPSKLPVRTASLPKETIPLPPLPVDAPDSPTLPPPSTDLAPLSSSPNPPAQELDPESDIDLDEPPRVPLEETGRDSPGRYIHGAPLHNVLEEEEED